MLLRLGQRRGLPILHVVRRPAQVELVRRHGGQHVLNSSDPDFVEQLGRLTRDLRATLFLDAIGGSLTQQLADAAPYGSTVLLYSRLSDQPCFIDPRTALVKNLHFDGWFLGNWIREKNLLQVLNLSRHAQALLGSDLQSLVQQRLPLAQAQQAVAAYLQNMTAGKVLLVMDQQA
jgi:NADPH:quinone reductase-like Zn-dependent oxidoreductase